MKEKVPFNWGPEHQEVFNLMKKEIAKAPILAYYNPRKQNVLQTDATMKGFGACLIQEDRPVYFASKALPEAQKGYVAIEIKSLAVAWAMEKFHHFLCASHFVLETDQMHLEVILSQSINQATPRLQRILIRTFPYHFTDTIKFPKLYLYQITSQLNTGCDSLQQLRLPTQADYELTLLKLMIMSGWPSSIKQVPQVLQSYRTFWEELTVEDEVILKGTRIVILAKQHEAVFKQTHEGHLGLNKCKLHAKDTVYWPGLNDQLEKLVLNCELCLKYSHSKCKQEPSLSLGQEVPLYSWTKHVTDIFHFDGALYLLVVDYTSRFLVVHKLTSMTGHHIPTQCKLIFSEQGTSETLISDNGPCYTAEVFKNLMAEYSVNHITSSPQYPQSNGLAEEYVQIVKNLFYIA